MWIFIIVKVLQWLYGCRRIAEPYKICVFLLIVSFSLVRVCTTDFSIPPPSNFHILNPKSFSWLFSSQDLPVTWFIIHSSLNTNNFPLASALSTSLPWLWRKRESLLHKKGLQEQRIYVKRHLEWWCMEVENRRGAYLPPGPCQTPPQTIICSVYPPLSSTGKEDIKYHKNAKLIQYFVQW